MNLLNKDAHKFQRSCLPLLTCLILIWVLPFVLCQAEDKPLGDEHTNAVENVDILFKQSKVHWTQHDKKIRHLKDPTFRTKSYTVQRRHKGGFQKPSRGHAKHRKQTQNRNKVHKGSWAIQENSKRNHLNYLESEKKYFDYFPLEDMHRKLIPLKDEDVEIVLLQNDTFIREKILKSPQEDKKEKKISRKKRDILAAETQIRPKSTYVRNFLASEQGYNPPVLGLTNRISQADQYYSQGTANDPWNNRFTQPLNSFYLPVPRPFVPSSVPLIKYPIPGIYYNAFTPSGNHPVISRPNRPSVDNRFGDEEDRVIWEINYVGGGENSRTEKPVRTGGFGVSSSNGVNTVGGGFGSSSNAASSSGSSSNSRPVPAAPRSTPPPLIHTENRGRKTTTASSRSSPPANALAQTPIEFRPSRPILRTTTQPPVRGEPSKCVWAIVSCCSRNDLKVRYNCFEQIGCHGAFWDYNPCADNLMDAALKEADTFFQP